MSLAKSAWKRSFRLATMAGGMLKEEVGRFVGAQEAHVTRLKQAKLLVEELGRLKGTAMKFGQMLALESRDFLPPEVVAVLDKLQNQASFMPKAEVLRILRAELGDRLDLLRDVSPEPIAAASIGQVHRAVLGNRLVVVKVQYPGIQTTVESDLKIFRSVLERIAPLILDQDIDYSDLFAELKEVFQRETRYLEEARMTKRYGELAREIPGIRVPEVHAEVSSDRVLTLGFEEGETLSTCLQKNALTPELRQFYGELFLRVYITELCDWGLVQTDPNLGNFLLVPERRELVLLDFGATREYSHEFRYHYSRLTLAALAENRELCLECATEMNLLDPREDEPAREALYVLLTRSLSPFREAAFDFRSDQYVEEMRKLGTDFVRKLKFTAPPRDLIFLHRKLGGIFQILRRLEVTLDLRPFLEPHRRNAENATAASSRTRGG